MTPSGIPLSPRSLKDFVERHGGVVKNGAHGVVRRLVPVSKAGPGDLAPLLSSRYIEDATAALTRGAFLLVDAALGGREDVSALPGWFHPYAAWALAELLDLGDAPADAPVIGDGCTIGPGVLLLPRVRLGARVTIGAGAVIGEAGFGFAPGPGGAMRAIPHLGGVIIEDDVHIGALCTISAGTLSPTIVRKNVKLDAQVHVGHNCEIGEGTIIAAQCGLAGSVVVGRNVLMGGQVGIADHVTIGDQARVAAKSGVIGDVAANATVAGYPAVERQRWLRGLAELYKLAAGRAGMPPSSSGLRAPSSSAPPPLMSERAPGSVRPEAIIRRSEPPPPVAPKTGRR
jgi:UDP-3-O-[3-hydroxymyristoyl] glucosamine N-acyltransferase